MPLNETGHEKLSKKIDSEGDGLPKEEELKGHRVRRRARSRLNDIKVYIVIPSEYYSSKHRHGSRKNCEETPFAQHNICIYTCTCRAQDKACGTSPNDPSRIPCPAYYSHRGMGAAAVPCGGCTGLISLFKSICSMVSECVKYLALCMASQSTQNGGGLQCTCQQQSPAEELPRPSVEIEGSPDGKFGFGMKKAAGRRLYTRTDEETCRLLPTFNLDPREPEVDHLCCGTKKALKKERKWRRKEFKKMKKQRAKIEKLLARAEQRCRMGRFVNHEGCMVDPKRPYSFM